MSNYAIISFEENVYAIKTNEDIQVIEDRFRSEQLKENWVVWAMLENTTETEADVFALNL